MANCHLCDLPRFNGTALTAFYQRVRPSGGWWGPVASQTEVKPSADDGKSALVNWLLGSVCIYCTLFAFGKLLLGFYEVGLIFLLPALVTGYWVYRGLPIKSESND